MRTLNKNKSTLWCVNLSTNKDVLDVDGFFTGETEFEFGTPYSIEIAIYPSNGDIVERIFGKDNSFDMIAVSNDIVLTKDTLLFIEEPTENYDTTYDYKVSSIKKSLNTYQYGLKGRI